MRGGCRAILQAHVTLYQPEWELTLVLEPLEELEEFWDFFEDASVLTAEAVGVWKLAMLDAAQGGGPAAAAGGGGGRPGPAAAADLGSMASRHAREHDNGGGAVD